jgi:hypothetical protein
MALSIRIPLECSRNNSISDRPGALPLLVA